MRNPVFQDKALYHKATALCIANHCYESTVVPCTTHVFEARQLLAVASTPSVGAARLLTEGVDGAAGVERPPACDGGSTYTADMAEADRAERRMFGGTP